MILSPLEFETTNSICFLKNLSLIKFKPINPEDIILPFLRVYSVALFTISLEEEDAAMIVQSTPFHLYYSK